MMPTPTFARLCSGLLFVCAATANLVGHEYADRSFATLLVGAVVFALHDIADRIKPRI